jgi:hypothetical protein
MSHSRNFPPDLAAVFGLLFAPLLALPIGWFVFRFAEWSLVYLAVALAAVGLALLVAARLPLYRQRRFMTFGPRFLDPQHRRLYWRGYAFIVVSVVFLIFVLALPA